MPSNFLRAAVLCAGLLSSVPSLAAGLCGSRDDGFIRLAQMAFLAHQFCQGVAEIEDRDVGALAIASRVDVNDPVCQKDLARDLLAMKGVYEEDRPAWCQAAKRVLRENPLTQDLVRDGSADAENCGEIDKAAALIAGFQKHCPDFKVTLAGRTLQKLANAPGCLAPLLNEIDTRIASLRKSVRKGDSEDAAALWCRLAHSEHADQMESMGMALWVER